MNILAVFPTYRSSEYHGKVGGGEISNRILLEAMADRGHSVTVCTLNPGPHRDAYRNGVKVMGPFLFGDEPIYTKALKVISYKKHVEKCVTSEKPDIILSGTHGIGASLSVAKKYGIPSAVFIRAFENFKSLKDSNSRLKFLFKKIFYGDIGPSALKKADYLLPNSLFMSEVCHDYVPTSERRVIYPALILERVNQIKKVREPKNIFMISSADHKGFPIFQHLAEKFPELSFHVLGDSERGNGEESRKGNLIFHGWANVVESLSEKADLLLVPSVWKEPFGRVAIEGLISGVPTLVSNIGGLPEAVSFEKNLLVDAGSKSAWCKAISDFMENPQEVYAATERAQKNIHRFSLETQLANLEGFIVDASERSNG
ncbi:glycosyltransferase family 4 protein [Gynuella sunshinyii]|uniref:Glycosyltransferase n=1 Tax=Gynuella sunshinyii YC6258 TaxID=1445510 RepID=A0A0C5V7R6_9GAMM|nr:glycosyltransferase family 4 protein [Gynuella sunshinyii]AJQ95465.1 glycosyltransferase [Gynuella sunshinyii YC6258]